MSEVVSNATNLISFEIEELTHTLTDPYEGAKWMKYGSASAYGSSLVGCGLLGTVIWFEISGRAAPYRTVINQLVSWIIFEVR